MGSRFASRVELSTSGVHRPLVAGISGSGREGADSFVLASGYEDGGDFGEAIFYTGHGGRDPETQKQIGHQPLTRANLALAQNQLRRLPIVFVRGAVFRAAYVPDVGYRYDGLYAVKDYSSGIGRAGFFVWRFRLVRIEADRQIELSAGSYKCLRDCSCSTAQTALSLSLSDMWCSTEGSCWTICGSCSHTAHRGSA